MQLAGPARGDDSSRAPHEPDQLTADARPPTSFPLDVTVVCGLVALNLGLFLMVSVGRKPGAQTAVPHIGAATSQPAEGETVRITGYLRLVAGFDGELHLVGDGFEAITTEPHFGRILLGYRWAPSPEGADKVVVTGVRLEDKKARFRLLPGVPLLGLQSIEKVSDAASRVEVGGLGPANDPAHPAEQDRLCWLSWAVPPVGEPCRFRAVVRAVYADRLLVTSLAETAHRGYAVVRNNLPTDVQRGDEVWVSGTVAPDAAPGRLVVLAGRVELVSRGSGAGRLPHGERP